MWELKKGDDFQVNQDLLNLAKEMVAIRSVSKDGNAEISDYIEAWLKATGFDEIEGLEYTYKGSESKVNLVARKGAGPGGLAFLSHSHTVPGMEETWAAFDPVVKNGHLYGRGSCDMKGPLAATMIASAAVDATQLRVPLYIVVTADEEIGLYGAKYVVKHSRLLNDDGPDYGVVAEPTRLIPAHGHKGYAFIKVIAHGKAAHTSSGEGVSSNFLIAPFLADMSTLNERFQNDPSFMNDEFQPATNGFNMVITDDGQTNMTAAKTECVLTLRVMPEACTEEIVNLITEKAQNYGLEIAMARVTPPVYTNRESKLVRVACQATGSERSETIPFGTEGFHYRELMDLVILGPGDIAVAHTIGESIAVAELEKAVDVYARMIAKLCM